MKPQRMDWVEITKTDGSYVEGRFLGYGRTFTSTFMRVLSGGTAGRAIHLADIADIQITPVA